MAKRIVGRRMGEGQISTGHRLPLCLGARGGQCLRRAAELGLSVNRAAMKCGSDAAAVAAAVKLIVANAAAADLRCHVSQGLACPHAPITPSYRNRELRIGKALIRRFHRHCYQMETLEAFEAQGWPESIVAPFDRRSRQHAKNGLRDIIHRLNCQQNSRQRIQFSCGGGRVRWRIIGHRSK